MQVESQEPDSSLWVGWLGAARAESYRRVSAEVSLGELARWNQILCGAFLGDIGHVEVAFRNIVSHSLQDQAGQNDHWLMVENSSWTKLGGDELKSKIKDAKSRAAQGGKVITPDDVIAELSLGFWLNFLGKRYVSLHPDMVRHFKGLRGRNLRGAAPVGSRVRSLRNRAAHNHRILHRDLQLDWEEVMTFARLIDPALAEYLDRNSLAQPAISEFSQKVLAVPLTNPHGSGLAPKLQHP
jgi:hypothetical protein